jgi:hypothetical protein
MRGWYYVLDDQGRPQKEDDAIAYHDQVVAYIRDRGNSL